MLLPVLGVGTCPTPPPAYDVVVVGAGSSGIAAAIQAARRPNTTVALIEEGGLIGGQIVAAGVSTMDGGVDPPVRISGLFAEYRDRVWDYYGGLVPPLSPNTCYDTAADENTCSEPRVSLTILEAMLVAPQPPIPASSSLCLARNHLLTGVTKAGNVVTGVITSSNGVPNTWPAHVVIDATEYGDVIPWTGAVYRIGKRLSTDPPDSDNCIQDITYIAIAKQYDPIPSNLWLPAAADGGAQLNDEFHSLVYQTPYTGACHPFSLWPWHQSYRGLPDSSLDPPPASPSRTRSGINYANDYPGYYRSCATGQAIYKWRGTLKENFIEDPLIRAGVICAAKLRTLQFAYYMQFPWELSAWPNGDWGFADDEYSSPATCWPGSVLEDFETLMPPMPYVRESRRVLGVVTLNAADISRSFGGSPTSNRMRTAVALGDYGFDVHNCRDPQTDFEPEEDLENTQYYSGPFQLPFEIFIPEQIDGFLPAEKNLSYTRLAAGAARMQPSTMLVGQAAGAIAALAAEDSIQPRAVRVLDVQKDLLTSGAATALDTFVDVAKSHERWADVQLMSTYDIITDSIPLPAPGPAPTGFFTFGVDDSVGRASAAAGIVRAFRISTTWPTPPPPPQTFPDVPPWHPDYLYVEAFVRDRFDTSGCNVSGNFCPDWAVPRRRLAKWIAHAKWGASLPPPGAQLYSDVLPGDPDYLAIQAVGNEGLMFPCGGVGLVSFCPDTTAARGELARSLAQVLYKYRTLWP